MAETKGTERKCSPSGGSCLLLVALAMTVTVLGPTLIGFFLVKGRQYYSTTDVSNIPATEDMTIKHFPGYFRLNKELETLINLSRMTMSAPVNSTLLDSPVSCNAICPRPPKPRRGMWRRRKRQTTKDFTFHGCCVSNKVYLSPKYRQNVKGKLRHFVQFPRKRQYFNIEVCRQVSRCEGCRCFNSQLIRSAVVYKDHVQGNATVTLSDIEIDNFVFESSCVCLNN